MRLVPLLAVCFMAGCTQAFVEVRHERSSRIDRPPDTILGVGARWYFWDAYTDHLTKKVTEAVRDELKKE